MGGHGILYPHCLKSWDAPLCTPPNCAHDHHSGILRSFVIVCWLSVATGGEMQDKICCSNNLEIVWQLQKKQVHTSGGFFWV